MLGLYQGLELSLPIVTVTSVHSEYHPFKTLRGYGFAAPKTMILNCELLK